MVRPEGFELPTYRFVACCSIQLSYERLVKKDISRTLEKCQVFFQSKGNFFVQHQNLEFCLDHAENVS